jgi:hypothetical protein
MKVIVQVVYKILLLPLDNVCVFKYFQNLNVHKISNVYGIQIVRVVKIFNVVQ